MPRGRPGDRDGARVTAVPMRILMLTATGFLLLQTRLAALRA